MAFVWENLSPEKQTSAQVAARHFQILCALGVFFQAAWTDQESDEQLSGESRGVGMSLCRSIEQNIVMKGVVKW